MTSLPASGAPPSTSLRAHPRLLASSRQLERLRDKPKLPLLRQADEKVRADARRFVQTRELLYDRNLHNAHLNRAREMQYRVITLLVRWHQTGEEIYRKAVLDHIRDMGLWEHWSWEQSHANNPDPKSWFDLSYGENSATLALAYDWLHAALSGEERALFRQIAFRRALEPFLAKTEEGSREWWFGLPLSNWNTVCAGGAGMLALAMAEEIPEAAEVVRRVEISFVPYFESLNTNGGGWVEGVGYWNYGHRYAFWYLLSHECATGRVHPLMEQPGTRKTLDFPFDFCPNGQPCGFGDVNLWAPFAFNYAVAARFKRHDLITELDLRTARGGLTADAKQRPNAAELLIFHPSTPIRPTPVRRFVSKRYPTMDWCLLADQMPRPNLYLSIRGGTTDVPHGHVDLLSFHCVVGQERLIDNIGINGGEEYLDTTFSSRRFDLLETRPESKNTLFVNGIGVRNPSTVQTTQLKGKNWTGVRFDATEAVEFDFSENPGVKFCARLFLLLDGPIALILDRVVLRNPGRMEARFHTFSRMKMSRDKAEIQGKKERLQLAFAATVPSTLHRAQDSLTTPNHTSTVLRWCTDRRVHPEISFATLLVPGQAAPQVTLEDSPKHLLAQIRQRGKARRLKVSKDLLKIVSA